MQDYQHQVLKIVYQNQKKRFRILPHTYEELTLLIKKNFPQLSTSNSLIIKYKDKENDIILISSTEDLNEAYTQSEESKITLNLVVEASKEDEKSGLDLSNHQVKKEISSSIMLSISPKHEEKKGTIPSPPEKENKITNFTINEDKPNLNQKFENINQKILNESIHIGFQCEKCKLSPIVGKRFKCTQCENFNICQKCEQEEFHSDHLLLQITTPDQDPILIISGKKNPKYNSNYVNNYLKYLPENLECIHENELKLNINKKQDLRTLKDEEKEAKYSSKQKNETYQVEDIKEEENKKDNNLFSLFTDSLAEMIFG